MVNGEDNSYFNTRGLVLTAPWVAAVVSGPDAVQCASSCALGLNSPLLLAAQIAKRYRVGLEQPIAIGGLDRETVPRGTCDHCHQPNRRASSSATSECFLECQIELLVLVFFKILGQEEYADNTILSFSVELPHLLNLKHVIMWFEQISGMRVNFHKSELITMNVEQDIVHQVVRIFNCSVGKYLVVSLHHSKLSREDIQLLVDKIFKRIARWRGKLLSLATRGLLIKTCLASIPIYLLSFIKFPKWDIKILNTQISNCLWNDMDEAHRYHLANQDLEAVSKEFGDLGIPNLRDLNLCLLASG